MVVRPERVLKLQILFPIFHLRGHSHAVYTSATTTTTTMSDFPDLGSEFATAPSSAIEGNIDFDKAVSAFPDISLDGEGDFSTPLAAVGGSGGGGGFSFDDFGSPPPPDVKVTGDDEIEKFEDQFPDIDVPGQVCVFQLNVICRYGV